VVSGAGPGHLEVRAADWWTATNVGLNRVELRSLQPGVIRRELVTRLIADVDAEAASSASGRRP